MQRCRCRGADAEVQMQRCLKRHLGLHLTVMPMVAGRRAARLLSTRTSRFPKATANKAWGLRPCYRSPFPRVRKKKGTGPLHGRPGDPLPGSSWLYLFTTRARKAKRRERRAEPSSARDPRQRHGFRLCCLLDH